MGKLKALADNRKNILLAELAAWLHDWHKSIDMAVASHWKKSLYVDKEKITQWQKRGKCLKPGNFASVLDDNLQVCNEAIRIKEIIETGREPSKASKSPLNIVQLLGYCHGKAHMEKELEEKENEKLSTDWISSPFGGEFTQPEGFLEGLLKISKTVQTFIANPNTNDIRKRTIQSIKNIFVRAWGDTRRPINEVTLWDWSSIVAALYKAEIARCVLTGKQRNPKNVQWRLLSIRTDGLGYLLSSHSIPDLLARKGLLEDAFDKVQILLEEVYPLGLEVYRDENGAVFVVPDISDLLDYVGELKEVMDYIHKPCVIRNVSQPLPLRELIKICFKSGTVEDDPGLSIDFELSLDIKLSKEWDGQNKLPPIGEILSKPPQIAPDRNDLEKISGIWEDDHREEICSVCGLRPQGWGADDRNYHYCRKHHKKGNKYTVRCQTCKAISRRVCYVCMQRRSFRSREWVKNLNTTIWMDEVADQNGRVALIVGKFDLTHWIDGTLVRSLAVRTPNDQNGHTTDEVAKNPSFARLRRIWETTKNFWEKILDNAKENIKVDRRLYLDVEIESGELGPYHAYEIILKGVKIPVLWDPDGGRLWIIDNLLYLSNRWNIDAKDRSFNEIKNEFGRLKDGTLKIYDPGGYGKEGRQVATARVKGVEEDSTYYSQVISILTEPQVFMILVPANKSMEIVKEIKTKYEREMGKVRNRLPLHLGVVFAHRMMPLRAILDAGKRMLERESKGEIWVVKYRKTFGQPNDPKESRGLRLLEYVKRSDLIRENEDPENCKNPKNYKDYANQFRMIHCVKLESEKRKGKQLIWYIPALMGDGQTEDNWYPYVFLASCDKPTERQRYYETENPWNSAHKWVVHAGDLNLGDKVYFTPATFDFIFLESNVKRHDVAYDGDGRRITDRRKPYLLDEVEDLKKAWNILSENLTSSQIHQMIDLIETARENWFGYGEGDMWEMSSKDETFKGFCKSVIVNAEWEREPNEREINDLTNWAVSGLLTDAFTLNHRMMKLLPP